MSDESPTASEHGDADHSQAAPVYGPPVPAANRPSASSVRKRQSPNTAGSIDIFSLLYNSNPFYFISALMVLGGIRLAYGEIPVGSLNCWGMLASLAGYTALMAAVAVIVIRVGRVWDDARSILVTLVLLFVAMSVSFDELLIIEPNQALSLTLAGWLFAVVITEIVLRLTHIKLPIAYRAPYHAAVALLFWFPYFASPELTGFTADQTELRLLAFPWLFAAIALSLLPAVRRGAASVPTDANGPPWKWPTYPWALFVFLGIVGLLRSYVLTFSFGPSDGFETSFGALHLMPMGFGLAVLLLEVGIRRERALARWAGLILPALCIAGVSLDVGSRQSAVLVFDAFQEQFGDPRKVAYALATAFYLVAWLRRVALADLWLAGSTTAGVIALCGTGTTSIAIVPIILLGGIAFFAIGVRKRSAVHMLVGGGLLSSTWLVAPLIAPLDQLRVSAAIHTAVFMLMLIGPIRGGRFGRWIINGVIVFIAAAGIVAFANYDGQLFTPDWTLSYIGTLACISAVYARAIGDSRFFWLSGGLATLFVGRIAISGVAILAKGIGVRATGTLVGGSISFIIAIAISMRKSYHKAGWGRSSSVP